MNSLVSHAARLLSVVVMLVLLGCATPPTITSKTTTASPSLCRSLIVLSPPAIYLSKDPKTNYSGGMQLEVIAQSLLTQVSSKLNEAGNDTSTTLLSRPGSNLKQEISLRHSASGVSHALVVAARRATFVSGLPREIEVEATLLDAATFDRQWEFQYSDKHAAGDAVPKATQALIKSLRESGFVK